MFLQQVVLADKFIFLVTVPASDNPSASQVLYTWDCFLAFLYSINKLQTVAQTTDNHSAN